MTVPPVAVKVTAGGADEPSLQEPDTVNCWVAPVTRVAEAGFRMSWVSVAAVMVTAAVSASVPAVWRAMTR